MMKRIDTSTCVHCRKHADKRCANCKSVGYCSKVCQVADFKKHKLLCNILKSINGGGSSSLTKSACDDLKKFSTTCRSNPLPLLSSSCKKFPLEQLIPFFQLHFVGSFQCQMVHLYSPLISATMADSGKTISLILDTATADKKMANIPTKQTFVPYREFCQDVCSIGDKSMKSVKQFEETLMKAYLLLCFHSKCNQVACCFGLLVLKTLHSHQFTYQGERIIGWAIQDGDLNLQHERLVAVDLVHLDKKEAEELLPSVIHAVERGTQLPERVHQGQLLRNTVHMWLSFVLESGRIFDLDLSAFQFGQFTFDDCVVPVKLGDPMAFHGMCDRDRLMGVNLPSFETDVNEIIHLHADTVRASSRGISTLNGDVMKRAFLDMIDQRLLPSADDMMADFAEPTRLWNVLKSLTKHS